MRIINFHNLVESAFTFKTLYKPKVSRSEIWDADTKVIWDVFVSIAFFVNVDLSRRFVSISSGGVGADDAWCWHGATLSSVGGHSVTATIPTSRYNNSLDISTYLLSDGEYI